MRAFAVFLLLLHPLAATSQQAAAPADVKLALAKYDAKVKISGPDAMALAPIARDVLRRDLSSERGDLVFAAAALERLAGAGDADALEQLKRSARNGRGISGESLAPIAALARLGDADAQARLGAALASASSPDRVGLLQQLQDIDARALAPKIRPLLADTDPQVRCQAALAVAALHDRDAIPALRQLFASDAAVVKLFAAAALKRLGDSSADGFLSNVLGNGLAEARLIAAEGYQEIRTPGWTDSMRGLLTGPDALTRIRAAELVACCAPEVARATLALALKDDLPPLRLSAAAALEHAGLADAALARRMIDDPLPGVRLHGAGAALALAKSKTPAKRPR